MTWDKVEKSGGVELQIAVRSTTKGQVILAKPRQCRERLHGGYQWAAPACSDRIHPIGEILGEPSVGWRELAGTHSIGLDRGNRHHQVDGAILDLPNRMRLASGVCESGALG